VPDYFVQPKQRAQIGNLIVAVGLDPADFYWGEDYTGREIGPGQEPVMVTKLIHQPSGYWFVFDVDNDRHFNRFAPGRDSPQERQNPGSWELQLRYVRDWLIAVRENIEAVDVWEQLQSGGGALPPGGENTPFTDDERTAIEQQLRGVLETLRETQQLTGEQLRVLGERVDEAVEATRRFGRLEWRRLLIGATVEAAMERLITFAIAGEFLRLALHGLGQLFGGGLPALP
jgi:hypothetical protein